MLQPNLIDFKAGSDIKKYFDGRKLHIDGINQQIKEVLTKSKQSLNATELCLAETAFKIRFYTSQKNEDNNIDPHLISAVKLIFTESLHLSNEIKECKALATFHFRLIEKIALQGGGYRYEGKDIKLGLPSSELLYWEGMYFADADKEKFNKFCLVVEQLYRLTLD